MSKHNITPLGEKVLLSPVTVEEKTAAGIYRPDAGEQKSQVGEVIALGKDVDIAVKVGENVLYKKFAGDEIAHNSKDYVIIKGEDILAVVA